jgi:hypothetical protein
MQNVAAVTVRLTSHSSARGDFDEALDRLTNTRPQTFAGLVAKAKAFRIIEPDSGYQEDQYRFNEDIVALASEA